MFHLIPQSRAATLYKGAPLKAPVAGQKCGLGAVTVLTQSLPLKNGNQLALIF
jgi:hypothetical protein